MTPDATHISSFAFYSMKSDAEYSNIKDGILILGRSHSSTDLFSLNTKEDEYKLFDELLKSNNINKIYIIYDGFHLSHMLYVLNKMGFSIEVTENNIYEPNHLYSCVPSKIGECFILTR